MVPGLSPRLGHRSPGVGLDPILLLLLHPLGRLLRVDRAKVLKVGRLRTPSRRGFSRLHVLVDRARQSS